MLEKVITFGEKRESRIEICMKCEHLKGVMLMRCAKCGCAIKAKVTAAWEKCPEGKW